MADFGDLVLADAMLGRILEEMIEILRQDDAWSGRAQLKAALGSTTRQAARDLRKRVEADPDLFPDTAIDWINRVRTASAERNAIVHAHAVDRCIDCGTSSHYHYGAAAENVDRSPARVDQLTEQLLALTREGEELGRVMVSRVNKRVIDSARATAAKTGDSVLPPQFSFAYVVHHCGDCSGTGRGETVVQLGTAVEVLPPKP
jgi:hypothetical protein